MRERAPSFCQRSRYQRGKEKHTNGSSSRRFGVEASVYGDGRFRHAEVNGQAQEIVLVGADQARFGLRALQARNDAFELRQSVVDLDETTRVWLVNFAGECGVTSGAKFGRFSGSYSVHCRIKFVIAGGVSSRHCSTFSLSRPLPTSHMI